MSQWDCRECRGTEPCCFLSVSHQNVTEIPAGIPETTKYLYIHHTNVQSIISSQFSNLHACIGIYVKYSRMSKIEAGAFHGLHNLEILHLSHR